jgi:hypothetical protein
MAYLASSRNKLTVPADGVVEIRVELIGDRSPTPRVWLQCIPCGDELQENSDRHLFECPECGYEMTFPEAGALAGRNVEAIHGRFDIPENPPRRGLIWRFLGLFVSKKRLSAPKS